MKTRFAYLPMTSSISDAAAIDQLIEQYHPLLTEIGGERWDAVSNIASLPLFFLVMTGGTERQILRLCQKRRETVGKEPTWLIAHGMHNSLPAALEVLGRLQSDGTQGKIFYVDGSRKDDDFAMITHAVHDWQVKNHLRSARIGMLGAPSDWLLASSQDAAVVREKWGPMVVPMAFEALVSRWKKVDIGTIDPIATPIKNDADAQGIAEPTADDMNSAVRLYLALRQMVEQEQLQALTVRCFDLIEKYQTTGCIALAELNDQGIIAGCEGDLPSTLAMLWAYELTGKTPWIANPSRLDRSRTCLWLAHCTVARSAVQSYRLRSHFESRLGVALQGEYPQGPVTLLRLGGRSLEKTWLAEGEVLGGGNEEDLCRTQVRVGLSSTHIDELLHQPLGNHLVLVPGHHGERFKSWKQAMLV